MLIFISNSITRFKTRCIPKDSIIVPFEKFTLKETIQKIQSINPSTIICENESILKLLKPTFSNLEILSNQPSYNYINNKIPQNIFYILISLISTIFFALLFNKNIQNIILVLIFFSTSFISLVLCYSESTRWDTNFIKLIDL